MNRVAAFLIPSMGLLAIAGFGFVRQMTITNTHPSTAWAITASVALIFGTVTLVIGLFENSDRRGKKKLCLSGDAPLSLMSRSRCELPRRRNSRR